MTILRKTINLTDAKIFDATPDCPNGSFSGYASIFGNFDRQGEAVLKGAYLDTLERFKQDGFIAIGHDWSGLPQAYIVEAYEDDIGLWIKGNFHSTKEAQDLRTIMQERIAANKSVRLSIGYKVLEDERVPDGRLLKKLDLYEVSFVTVPANPLAAVTGVKNEEGLEDASGSQGWGGKRPTTGSAETLREPGGNAVTAGGDTRASGQSEAQEKLWHSETNGEKADENQTVETAQAEKASEEADKTEGRTETKEGKEAESTAQTGQASNSNLEGDEALEEIEVLLAGTTLEKHHNVTLAVVGGYLNRQKSVYDLRAKQGRVLSRRNADRIVQIREELARTLAVADELLALGVGNEPLEAELSEVQNEEKSVPTDENKTTAEEVVVPEVTETEAEKQEEKKSQDVTALQIKHLLLIANELGVDVDLI